MICVYDYLLDCILNEIPIFLLNIVSITDTDHTSERCQAMCVEMAYRTESCDMYKLMSHN